jgi:ornithine--oxo-acid transaminase
LECELKKGDVAAFFFEPVQGKGVYHADASFYKNACELCQKYGALTVCDEVQTGLGRTGKMFAHEHYGIKPDIVTIAKALSGGFVPIGAILYGKKIYAKVFRSMEECVIHSNTFGRNILAMAAGLKTLEVFEEDGVVQNSARMGNLLSEGIKSMAAKYEMLSEVRGMGLMIGIEFSEPKSFKLKTGWKIIHALNKSLFSQMIIVPLMKQHRILTQVAGHNVDIIKLLPPLIIDETHVGRFLQGFEDVVAECHKFPGGAWKIGKDLATAAAKSKKILQGELSPDGVA